MLVSGGGGMQKPPLLVYQALFWDAFIAFFIFMGVWLCSDERQGSIEYLASSTWLGIGIIIAGSSMAFVFNLATYFFIMYTSALTSTVGSIGIKIFLIAISAITDHIDMPLAWVGIAIVICAIGAYGYLQVLSKLAPPPADPKAQPLNEKTPLRGSAA